MHEGVEGKIPFYQPPASPRRLHPRIHASPEPPSASESMAVEMILRASGKVGAVAANKAKGAACRAVAIACGALGFVAGAAYVVYRRGRAFIADLFSPATPIARRHDTHR